MVERQDIDALLIGALYGELTPADEARLQTHFESHPGDRSALNAMTDTRLAVRESRILQVQLEPPQAVSALLLQEAARRAPRKVERSDDASESWFARFLRSFVAHPAMAAAGMLVLVIGVAGTMYLRKGDQFAEKTVVSARELAPAQAAGSAAPEGATATSAPASITATEQAQVEAAKLEAQAGSGSSYGVGLAGVLDESDGKDKPAEPSRTERKGSSYIEVKQRELQPKELDEKPRPRKPALTKPSLDNRSPANDRDPAASGPGAATTKSAPAPTTETQVPQAAPPPPPTSPPSGEAARDQTVAGRADSKVDPAETAVRELHARLVTQVKSGNCREAASLAIEISGRSRAYYAQNVENDRALKACRAYISTELERETVRAQKRATQKRATEPAKPAQK